jgi:outer membrane protein insertion porin family
VPDLDAVLGHSSLYSTRASIAHDTRDSTFLPTEGHYITATFEYFMGTFQYPWVALNAQQHWLLRERPDGTGRHTFSYYNQLGFSGPDTPIYERFYAGGFSTLRGFQFRGASPQDMTVLVGGDFQFLNTLEYMFPITADDMLKMVAFVDFGTVESDVRIDWDQFRIAPGLGIRVTIPMISPAPIAIDFAVPVKHAPGDLLQNVSFFVGVGR